MGEVTGRQYALVGIATLMHFLVDGLCLCCTYLLTSPFNLPHLAAIFITYNLLAFLSQPLTGWMADRIRHKHWMLLGAVMLLAVAVLVTPLVMSSGGESTMFAVAALLGIGNSLFHVWGGKQVVLQVGNDIRALGVFVSTGAFGLAVAIVFCSWTLLYIFLLGIIVLATAYVMTDKSESQEHIQRKELPTNSANRSPLNTQPSPNPAHRSARPKGALSKQSGERTLNPQRISFVIAIAAFVMFRSYLGKEFSLGAANTDAMILLVGFVTMLGKMAGGWISRWMGVVKALTMILIVVLVCMLTQRFSPVLPALAGLFMINCTMPITLYLANSVLPEREGLAFGILAAALMPGYLVK